MIGLARMAAQRVSCIVISLRMLAKVHPQLLSPPYPKFSNAQRTGGAAQQIPFRRAGVSVDGRLLRRPLLLLAPLDLSPGNLAVVPTEGRGDRGSHLFYAPGARCRLRQYQGASHRLTTGTTRQVLFLSVIENTA